MNLPNYFLADLPPEATLSPLMITEACQTLKRNRAQYLVHRSTERIVHLLCDVAEAWLKPDNTFRKLALEQTWNAGLRHGEDETKRNAGPEAGAPGHGFSRATLEKGLDQFFRQFTPENFRELLAQELGETGRAASDTASRHLWRGPELLVHVAAGNIPNPTLMSLTLGLLTRSAQFVKCAQRLGIFCLDCLPTRFTKPTPSWAPAWKSPNGAAATPTWKRPCLPRRIA